MRKQNVNIVKKKDLIKACRLAYKYILSYHLDGSDKLLTNKEAKELGFLLTEIWTKTNKIWHSEENL